MFSNSKTGGVVSVLLQSLTDNQLGFSWETLVCREILSVTLKTGLAGDSGLQTAL